LLAAMNQLHRNGIHCGSCSGICCTHLANSMKITREEAEDLQAFLVAEGRWNGELMESLRETVRRYRLDQEVGYGRRVLRKTYTCPFYAGGALGCTIAPTHKPYGCLAFNPRSPGLTAGGDCVSDVAVLEQVQTPDGERLPIPMALLALATPALPV
jgi:Fe-S-cluster containining protein